MILLHTQDNPRNSEGSFIKLKDGRILFFYSRFTSVGWDHDPADIAVIESLDNGRTWSDTSRIALRNSAQNVMSVSLLRLANGVIMMLFLEKKLYPYGMVSCLPMVCFSNDECETWSTPKHITSEDPMFLVVNNDRVIQLANGRIIVPYANHGYLLNNTLSPSVAQFAISDDNGETWRTVFGYSCPEESVTGCQEPGVIELMDGTLFSWTRTRGGCQYKSFSTDYGETWSPAVPAQEFPSNYSPLSMKRDPVSGKLVAIWNYMTTPYVNWWLTRKTLVCAVSPDEGQSWSPYQILADEPEHGYCYTAMFFLDDAVLLAYCSGIGEDVLRDLTIRRLPLKDIAAL